MYTSRKSSAFSAAALVPACAIVALAVLAFSAGAAQAQSPQPQAKAERAQTGTRIVRKAESTEEATQLMETVTVGSVRNAREAQLERRAADSDTHIPALPQRADDAFLDDDAGSN